VDRLGQELGTGVLEQEAAGAGLERAVHVLVEVEGRDDHDRERVLDVRAGEQPRRLDAVELGHAHVDQAYVGAQLARQRDRLAAVGGLGDHVDAGLGVEDHPEPGADELLVVGDEDPDAHLGSTAVTVHPRPGLGPASSVPPSSAARSAIPARP
jgi:hypothetical protein